MIGLLRKELYVADRSFRLLVVFALVFSLIPGMSNFGTTYAIMMAMSIPLNSIAYDEKSKWDRYAAMLPYKPGQLVWTKYLLAYLFTVLAEAIVLLGSVIRGRISHEPYTLEDLLSFSVLLLGVMPVMIAAVLPPLYRFGSEKGRLVMLVFMGIGVGITLGLAGIFGEVNLSQLPLAAAVPLFVLVVVAATYGSFRLSVHFYRKRQNGAYN